MARPRGSGTCAGGTGRAEGDGELDLVHAMVGTAGHVSHGKSTLVEVMTGCEMNRLPEERARGLTIDLGFARCELGGERLIGIVDVPGHRDFIRNMAAGASSIDVLLLVVAADDGVMPQTVEHARIASLLGARRVVAVVTKADRADAETVEIVRGEVAALLERTGLGPAPIVTFSAKTLRGLDEVRSTLEQAVGEVALSEADDRAFRMDVERVFTVRGHGTVVTGIPSSGRLPVGAEAEALPSGRRVTVRAVENYGRPSAEARRGSCAAVNLRGPGAEGLERGTTLAAPGVYRATRTALVTVRNVTDDTALARMTDVRLHAGTSAVRGSLRLIGAEKLAPGAESLADVRLEGPAVLAAGDRFLVRTLSPSATVGGGRVITARPGKIRRSSPEQLSLFKAAKARAGRGDWLAAEFAAGTGPVLTDAEAVSLTLREGPAAREELARLEASGELDRLGEGWLVAARAPEVARRFVRALEEYHRSHPYTTGMEPGHAAELAAKGLSERSFTRLASALGGADPRVVVRNGRLALSDFEPALDEGRAGKKIELERRLAEAGPNAPSRAGLAEELGLSTKDMRLLVRLLEEEGRAVSLGSRLVDASALEDCRRKVREVLGGTGRADLAELRAGLGVGRNQAVAILERLDSEGLTRREGNSRVPGPRLEAAGDVDAEIR